MLSSVWVAQALGSPWDFWASVGREVPSFCHSTTSWAALLVARWRIVALSAELGWPVSSLEPGLSFELWVLLVSPLTPSRLASGFSSFFLVISVPTAISCSCWKQVPAWQLMLAYFSSCLLAFTVDVRILALPMLLLLLASSEMRLCASCRTSILPRLACWTVAMTASQKLPTEPSLRPFLWVSPLLDVGMIWDCTFSFTKLPSNLSSLLLDLVSPYIAVSLGDTNPIWKLHNCLQDRLSF